MDPIKPMLPNKPRGVPWVDDRRVLNGIFSVLRSGAHWRDPREAFGPYTTCYNRLINRSRCPLCSDTDRLCATAANVAKGHIRTHAAQQYARFIALPSARKNQPGSDANARTVRSADRQHQMLVLRARPHHIGPRGVGLRVAWITIQ